MSILRQIEQQKRREVAQLQRLQPLEVLREQTAYARECVSLRAALLRPDSSGIIAEFKRQSPSKGLINGLASPAEVVLGYSEAGAAAVSVLTDQAFFGARGTDFALARAHTRLPLLRKDFIVDAYQVFESKAMGADVILLIAALLSPEAVDQLAGLAHQLGMEVLLEVHSSAETDAYRHCTADMMGINNRNLNTFGLDIRNSLSLAASLPADCLAVAESGIESVEIVRQLRSHGFRGFLIGEYFMRQAQPELACNHFIHALRYEN